MPADGWLHCSPLSRKDHDQKKELNDMRDPSDQSDGNAPRKSVGDPALVRKRHFGRSRTRICRSPHSQMSELRGRGRAMPIHRHRSPQLRRGCEDVITGAFCALNGAHRPCKRVGRPGALADSCSRVDRKNPACFSGDTVFISLGTGRADCGDRPASRDYYYGRLRSLLHCSIRHCRTRVAARSRVECTFKWFLPTI